MAKPLGAKSLLIRAAIQAHPDKGNKNIAELLNDSHDRMDDKIEVTPQDVAQQKQQMKKPGATMPAAAQTPTPEPANGVPAPESPVPAKRGRPKGSLGKPKKAVVAPAPKAAPSSASPADLIDRVFALAEQCGGFKALQRVVNRLAER